MEPIDRTAPATLGDLHDVRDELRAEMRELRLEIRGEIGQMFQQQTLTLAGEIARAVDVAIEHNQSLFRAATDGTRAVSDRLDVHVDDANAHRR